MQAVLFNDIKQRVIMFPRGSSGELCMVRPAGASHATESPRMSWGSSGQGIDLLGKEANALGWVDCLR